MSAAVQFALRSVGSSHTIVPLTAADPLEELTVPGFQPAVVSLPLGARGPRPLIIAAHGNFDRPEWQCAEWRALVGDRAFVLCPRGTPRSDSPSARDTRFSYGRGAALDREIGAAITALVARYPFHVDVRDILYTGFSLGAYKGVDLLARRGGMMPRAVLVEGGHDQWTAARAKRFHAAGGDRVLFACGQRGCVAGAKRAKAILSKAGVEVQIAHAAGGGHSYGGAIHARIRDRLPWLLGDDPRYAPLLAAATTDKPADDRADSAAKNQP